MPTKTQVKSYIKRIYSVLHEDTSNTPTGVSIVLDFNLVRDEKSKKFKYILKFSGFDHREDMTFDFKYKSKKEQLGSE